MMAAQACGDPATLGEGVMKWLTAANVGRAAHVGATVAIAVLLLVGEPECAAALARLGVVPLGPSPAL